MTVKPLFDLLEQIDDFLFAGGRRRLSSMIEQINDADNRYRPKPTEGFVYAGVYYRPESLPAGPPHSELLNPELEDQILTYLDGMRTIDLDSQFIRQNLTKVLRSTESWQDIRDALPNSLASVFPETQNLPRYREPGYTIKGDERSEKQYQKFADKIEIYATARLIF